MANYVCMYVAMFSKPKSSSSNWEKRKTHYTVCQSETRSHQTARKRQNFINIVVNPQPIQNLEDSDFDVETEEREKIS